VHPAGAYILVVDDNQRNLAIMKKILGARYRLALAASGEEALAIAEQFVPDLVLLDIMMPGIDGYETCRRLRANDQLKHAKIIMVSAKALTSERLEGYAAGADDYVTKPFDEDELLAKIEVYRRLKSAEEISRLKSDLLDLFDHETRTPLTAIMTPTAMLLDDATLTAEQRQLLIMVQSGAQGLHRLVTRVSFLSSLRAGMVQFDLERHDLSSLVLDFAELMRPAAHAAQVQIRTGIAPQIQMECDATHMRTAVCALLDNAVRYTRQGGTIDVRLAQLSEHASLTVADQGPGIPPALLPHLFEEFAVTDVAHHHAGHGLSLAITRSIVQRHGGTIAVHSPAGQGSEFELVFPVCAPVPVAVT
jgi:two-component system sensor histidine kinase/response regulator